MSGLRRCMWSCKRGRRDSSELIGVGDRPDALDTAAIELDADDDRRRAFRVPHEDRRSSVYVGDAEDGTRRREAFGDSQDESAHGIPAADRMEGRASDLA